MLSKDFLIILENSIKNTLSRQKDELFHDEKEFHLKLSIELNKYMKQKYPLMRIPIIVEFYDILFYVFENDKFIPEDKTIINSARIDIALFIDNQYFLVELKYSAYDELARDIDYKAGTNKHDIIKGFKADVKKLEKIKNDFSSIESGYCILLITSNLIQELNIQEIEKDLKWKWNEIDSEYSYCIKCIK